MTSDEERSWASFDERGRPDADVETIDLVYPLAGEEDGSGRR